MFSQIMPLQTSANEHVKDKTKILKPICINLVFKHRLPLIGAKVPPYNSGHMSSDVKRG